MSTDSVDLLCEHCGQTFSAFLHEMANKNAKVVCPNCRESVDCRPPKGGKAAAAARPAKKPH